MFRFHKSLDVITLFHKPSLPASIRIHTMLKQASAKAAEVATEDQASDHSAQSKTGVVEFDLDVSENPPTPDQLKNIIDYLGGPRMAGSIIKGASSEADALKKLKESPENFKWPVTVDWNNGRVVAGDNESQILKMVESLPKS